MVETDPGRARAEVERMCEQLLANTIIENYAYELDASWRAHESDAFPLLPFGEDTSAFAHSW